MDNESNLRPQPHPPFKSGTEAQEMGRLGGIVKSENKVIAARLRELKKKGLTDETSKEISKLTNESPSAAIDILMIIKGFQKKDMTSEDRALLSKFMIEWYKIWHGTKVNVKSESLSVDVQRKEYHFIIENRTEVKDVKSGSRDSMEANRETEDSI